MNQEMIGWVVLSLISILGLFTTLYNLFFKPVQKLTTEITLLNNNLKTMQRDYSALEIKVLANEDHCRLHDKTLTNHEYRLKTIEKTHYEKHRI